MNGISENSHTIMFPLPLELISIMANPGPTEDNEICYASDELSADYLDKIESPAESNETEKMAGNVSVA